MDDVNNARCLKYRSKFFISEFLGTDILLLGFLVISQDSGTPGGYYILSQLAGPRSGTLLASLAGSLMARRITIAKLYHFDSESESDALLRKHVP